MKNNLDSKLLVSQFPIRFGNDYIVDSLAFWCTRCGRVATTKEVYGQTSRLIPSTVDVWASYRCSCGHTDTHRIRIKDDKSCTYLSKGRWTRIVPPRLKPHQKVANWCIGTVYLLLFKWQCYRLERGLKKLWKTVENS
jgi:hypothetical protein